MSAPEGGHPAPVYPVGLRLTGRPVVVVGGGQVAHRRVAGLLDAGAQVGVVSPAVTPALEALIEPGSVTWLARRYAPGDVDGAWWVVAATDDAAVQAEIAAACHERRVFCVRADRADGGSARVPAVTRAR